LDKFPEAFGRFESVVNIDEIKDFGELKASFSLWAGEHWKGSPPQNQALKNEAHKLRIPTWRSEIFIVSGHSRMVHRDLVSGRFTKPSW